MSDDVLSVIPTDPHWQPDQAAADRAAAIVADLTSGHDGTDVDVTWHDTLTVVDCGANLERIGCPHCGTSIDIQWWADLMEAHDGHGFETLAIRVPCCAGQSSLDALDYDWPCGFARFEIALWNPERPWLSEEELTTLAAALGTPGQADPGPHLTRPPGASGARRHQWIGGEPPRETNQQDVGSLVQQPGAPDAAGGPGP